MFFLAIGIFFAMVICLVISHKYQKLSYRFSFLVLALSLGVFFILGSLCTELYYSFGDYSTRYEEIELHSKSDINIDHYVNQEKINVMDKDYNVIEIDFKQIEVSFSPKDTILYKRIKTPRTVLLKMFLLRHEDVDYTVQLYDTQLWLEEFRKQQAETTD